MKRLLNWIHCPSCKRWFGRHELFALVGDGVTDETVAMQRWLDCGYPLDGNLIKGTAGQTFKICKPLIIRNPFK